MPAERLRVRAGGLVEAAAALAAFGTLAAFGARWWWILELFSHFRVHYLLGLIVGGAWCAIARRRRTAALFVVCAAINLSLIASLYFSPSIPENAVALDGHSIRLMLANVHVHNQEHDRFLRFVREESPDVIIVLETNSEWLEALDALAAEYPHRISRARGDSFGLAFLSRLPTEKMELLEIGPAEVPSVLAQVDCSNGVMLQIIGTHPLPPISAEYAQLRNEQLRAVSELVGQHAGPAVLMGDLNATSWSPYFRDLVSSSGLRDSRLGFGVQPTWPGRLAAFGIPIDHALVSMEISVARRIVGPDIGSDHRPLIVDLRVLQRIGATASSKQH